MTVLETFVRCDTFTVTVRLGVSDALTPLERLVIRAVGGAGEPDATTRFAELADLFGLGQRIMLDLVFDLWRAGHLVVDTYRGVVELSDATARAVAAGTLDQANAVSTREEPRELMQERLTGMVLSTRRRPAGRPTARTVVPTHRWHVELAGASNADIVGALRDDVARENADTRRNRRDGDDARREPLKVLSAHVGIELLSQRTLGGGWLGLQIRPISDERTKLLTVEVTDDWIPHATRVEMARRIELLVETDPAQPFVQALLEAAGGDDEPVSDPEQEVDALLECVAGLPDVDPSEWKHQHGKLTGMAAAIESVIDDQRASQLDIELQAGRSRRDVVLRDMIRDAGEQLVIFSPRMTHATLRSLSDDIEEALKRGVHVFLAWGAVPDRELSASQRLDDRVQGLLQLLMQRYPNRLFVSQRSAGSNARLVIQDDRRACIASWQALAGGTGSAFELGVLLAAREADARCRVIERLLTWAQEQYPEYTASRSMRCLAEDFKRIGPPDDQDGGRSLRPSAPDAVASGDRSLAAAAATLWLHGWQAYAERLAGTLAAGAARRMRLTTDGQHKVLLSSALASATWRLVIAAEWLGRDVVDDPFLHGLATRLEDSEIDVTILFKQTAGSGTEHLTALRELESRFERLHVVQADSFATFLLCDDTLIVSSYGFLASTGYYERGDGGRQRSEIGIRIDDADLADELAAAARGAVRQLLELPEPVRPRAAHRRPAPRATGLAADAVAEAARLLDDLRESDEPRTVLYRTALRDSADPGELVAELDSAQLPAADRRQLIAAALALGGLAAPDRSRWVEALVRDLVQDGDLVAAAIVRTMAPDHPALPEQSVLNLAAVIDDVAFERMSQDVASLPAGHPDWAAVEALAALRLAAHGDHDAQPLLELAAGALLPAWSAVTKAIDAFFSAHRLALPSAGLVGLATVDGLDGAYARLKSSLGAAEGKRFARSLWAPDIHRHLHSPDGELGRLRAAVSRRDDAAIVAWSSRHGATTLGDMIDRAARAIGAEMTIDYGRNNYIKLLRAVVRDARDVAKLLPGPKSAAHDPALLDAAREVTTLASASWAQLSVEAQEASPAVALILKLVLHRLALMLGVDDAAA